MSVTIKGIEMPKKCSECYVCCNYMYVKIQKHPTIASYIDPRPDWCPLIEIPVPHGRLIDINDVISAKRPIVGKREKNYAMALYNAGWNAAIEAIIENAPTIIEAEDNNDEGAI